MPLEGSTGKAVSSEAGGGVLFIPYFGCTQFVEPDSIAEPGIPVRSAICAVWSVSEKSRQLTVRNTLL